MPHCECSRFECVDSPSNGRLIKYKDGNVEILKMSCRDCIIKTMGDNNELVKEKLNIQFNP